MHAPARRIPLFPLPLVLFPGAPLPLHIFEPRYRQLLADCLAGERRFGIVFRPEGVPERELPPGHVGCIARIESSEPLPDGRSNVLVIGERRFVIERLLTAGAPYHEAMVHDFDDDESTATEELEPLGERVRELFERVGRAARTLADEREALPSLPDDPALLSFAIASLIDLDPSRRQRLLASRSPVGRLRDLEQTLGAALGNLEQRAEVHIRAKANGHGPQEDS
jgi:Lon protease-like protein